MNVQHQGHTFPVMYIIIIISCLLLLQKVDMPLRSCTGFPYMSIFYNSFNGFIRIQVCLGLATSVLVFLVPIYFQVYLQVFAVRYPRDPRRTCPAKANFCFLILLSRPTCIIRCITSSVNGQGII